MEDNKMTDMEAIMADMEEIMTACESMKAKMEGMMGEGKKPEKMSRKELDKKMNSEE